MARVAHELSLQGLAFVKSNAAWRSQNEIYQGAIRGEETAHVARDEYTEVLRKMLKRQELDANIQEMPPSPGGHDSFCHM